ncbi:hypothetical protein AB0B89_23010 [Sphaerisporangium sp. NPDC049002]|uniref:hypothetical protein n=1 Tax=unclassified Sphaerisporangium TaxID=2630420 RepID=UPI0033C4C64D
MTAPILPELSSRHPAVTVALRLSRELERHGICSDVHEGTGLALVSVWVDLVVWTDGACYIWWSGAVSSKGRRLLSYCSTDDPVSAARRVAARYVDLRKGHPYSHVIAEALASIGVSIPAVETSGNGG